MTNHGIERAADERVNWKTSAGFIAVHLLVLLSFVTGVDKTAAILFVVLYWSRMFFITAGYHRYFSHRAYKLNRVMQFVMAYGGATAAQKGPLWWASHHRNHHRYSDTDLDLHLVRNGQLAFSATDDCSYQLKNPDWGTANYPNDDPYLDADVTSGGGPEVIDLLSAAESTYDLYVHYYESTLKPSTTATLTVYSHGTEIGSTVQAGMACGDLWHAGRIQMQAGAPVFTPAGGITPRTDRAMCH